MCYAAGQGADSLHLLGLLKLGLEFLPLLLCLLTFGDVLRNPRCSNDQSVFIVNWGLECKVPFDPIGGNNLFFCLFFLT